jgi:tetratricopeptide (TPR) repeat protein
MAKDKEKHLIPCFKGIDADDMPKEFARLQAQDLGKVGAIQDLLRGIEKILPRQTETVKETVVVQQPAVGSNPTVDSYLKRAFMFLEDGDWKSANEYCEKVLDQDPENAQAYLGKLLAEQHVRYVEELKNCAKAFEQSGNYQKAVRFGDEPLKDTLTGYIAHINIRNEKARMKGIYDRAKSIMLSSNSEKSYNEAAEQFEYISHYEDSAALAADCRAKAEVARKDAVLSTAAGKLARDTISDYQTAIALLQSIPGWRDADEKLAIAQEKLTKLEAHHMELERQAALKRQQTHAAALRNRKIILFIFVSTLVLSLSIFLALKIITPAYRYSTAVKLMEEGKYSEAHSIFSSLGEYRDCLSKIEELEPLQLMETLNNAQVGEYVYFGTYEQDNDFSNGAENIEWLVLDKKDDKILVISKYALCFQQYNTTTPAEAATWETCSLRRWLNRSFITDAFNYSERAAIPTVAVPAHNNATYNTDPGNDTLDQVFLLSSIEVQQYLGNGQQAQCTPTRYSLYSNSLPAQSYCTWWLRSPGSAPLSAAIVSTSGGIIDNGTVNRTDNIAVRPAMWIDPAKLSA